MKSDEGPGTRRGLSSVCETLAVRTVSSRNAIEVTLIDYRAVVFVHRYNLANILPKQTQF